MQATHCWAFAGETHFQDAREQSGTRTTTFELQGAAGEPSTKLGNLASQPLQAQRARAAASIATSASSEVCILLSCKHIIWGNMLWRQTNVAISYIIE